MNLNKKANLGMTVTEILLAMLVVVIFMSVVTLISKYFQSYMKTNFQLDSSKKSLVQNENIILKAIDSWSEILSQPSYSRDEINSLDCSYPPSNGSKIWNLPGLSDSELPRNYKYCVKATSFGESDLNELILGTQNSRPGIYFIYAIPDSITTTSRPIKRIMCRPITFC